MALLRDNWLVIAITVPVVIAALAPLWGIWWVWRRLPQHQVARLALKIRDPKARAATERCARPAYKQSSHERLRAARQQRSCHAAWWYLRPRGV
jgi:hypothetical protein